MPRTVYLYDDQDLLTRHNLHLVPGHVQKLGPVTWADGNDTDTRRAVFCGSVLPWEGGYRLYYSDLGPFPHDAYHLAVAHSADGLTWEPLPVGDDGFLHPAGLPTTTRLVQPKVVRLPDGRVRMYFWWHGHDQGRMPLLASESDDGLHFDIVNLDAPCLLHPSDLNVGQAGWAAGLTTATPREGYEDQRTMTYLQAKRLRSNDATFIYYNERLRLFEMYSVWLIPNDPETHRYTPHDNAPQILRVLHRRESEDGLQWSDPELLLVPDEHDPLEMEFYHLAVSEVGEWRLGMLGHYRCWDQSMDLELCFSRDGHHWQRPLRGGFIPRGGPGDVDHWYIYPTNKLIDCGDHWLMLYDGGNYCHNQQLPPGVTERRSAVMAATVPKGRFAGLRTAPGTIGSLELQCIPGAEAITVNADIRGTLRAELRDTYGRPLPGYHLHQSIPATGDSPEHTLRWEGDKTTAPYQYDAVNLRLELVDGTIYAADL